MNTRRNLALNDNTPADILEILAYDPTANVSYAASNHINYIGKIRDFSRDVIHPCVTCKKSYDLFNCSNCSEIKPY
jgi:hypothetical protein